MCLNDGYIPAEHMETDPGENSNFFYDYFFSKMYSTGKCSQATRQELIYVSRMTGCNHISVLRLEMTDR